MKAKLDIRVRINLADYGAFEELLSEQIKDPDIRELTIVYAEIDNKPVKVTKPAKVAKPTKPKKSFTKTRVTTRAVKSIRDMKRNYPKMSHTEIRDTVKAQTGLTYGMSTISEILSSDKYNRNLSKEDQLKYPPLPKRSEKGKK